MVPLNDGGKVVGLGFEIISELDSYFLMTVPSQRRKRVILCKPLTLTHKR